MGLLVRNQGNLSREMHGRNEIHLTVRVETRDRRNDAANGRGGMQGLGS